MDIEQLLTKITNLIKDGVHVIDDNGVTILYNRKMSIIQNREVSDVIGKRILDIYETTDGELMLLKVLNSGLPIIKQIYKGINKFGNPVITSNSIWPILENNNVVGAVEIATDITEIRRLSDKALKYSKHINSMANKKLTEHHGKYTVSDIVGESKSIENVKRLVIAASKCNANVMIIGDSGTGKELIAQSIHNESRRQDKPIIAENCAAIPENLFESILFGTTKGGFTGAIDKMGLFQLANGGTLILDEINSMPLSMQAKLLRVLQEGCFRPVGESKLVDVDVRLISITNEDPLLLIENKKLREDLFYRLSVINIYIPSLAERKSDIKILTQHYLQKLSYKNNKRVNGINQDVLNLFSNYDWKGNVRELANVIECGVDLVEDGKTIELCHMPYYFLKKAEISQKHHKESEIQNEVLLKDNINLIDYINDVEKSLIEGALEKYGGNISKAAESLGITRQALQHKLKSRHFNLNV